jgi:hypothetical protein
MSKRVFTHTAETDAVIKKGYSVKSPIIEIATRLQTTGGTIIGRARRLGLARAGNTEVGLAKFYADRGRRRDAAAKNAQSQRARRKREAAEARARKTVEA